MDEKILKKVYESVKNGEKAALAFITDIKGSTPGKLGASMVVFKDGSIEGSVGGGRIEYEVINSAIKSLEEEKDSYFGYLLNDKGDIGMQCGGEAKGYIKVFKPRPRIIIIGGGHIGLNLFNIARTLDFHTTIIDDREEFVNENRFNGADNIICGQIEDILSKQNINENTYIVITSKGYNDDLNSLRSVINKNPAYIGMIGSAKKWISIKEILQNEGVSQEKLNTVYAPVGLDISSPQPEEIAFAIISEILLVKNKGSLNHRKNLKNNNKQVTL